MMAKHCMDCGNKLEQLSDNQASEKYICKECNAHWFKSIRTIVEWDKEKIKVTDDTNVRASGFKPALPSASDILKEATKGRPTATADEIKAVASKYLDGCTHHHRTRITEDDHIKLRGEYAIDGFIAGLNSPFVDEEFAESIRKAVKQADLELIDGAKSYLGHNKMGLE